MKVFRLVSLLCLFLSGCSIETLFAPTPTNQPPASTSTALVSRTWTSTITPTSPTPTFTSTPTLIYLGPTDTVEPLDYLTATPGSIFSPTPAPTDTPPVLTLPQDSLFTTIVISGDQIFWGSCEPSSVKLTTHINDMSKVHTVTVWLRLENKSTGETTEWGGGAIMDGDGQGNFTYTLTASSFTHYREFPGAWGQYQLVASDAGLNRISGSSQYLNNLTISPCP